MLELKKKTLIHICLVTAVAVVLSAGAYLSGSLQQLEWMTNDWRAKHYRADRVLPEDIAVVLIDEASLKAMNPSLGRWPWPRYVYGEVLDFIGLGNPKAVVFDVLFTERERDDQVSETGVGENDNRFAEATAENGVVYHAMQLFRDDETDTNAIPLPHAFDRFEVPVNGLDLTNIGNTYNNFNRPIDALYLAAKGIGVVNVEQDADGVIRHIPMIFDYRGKIYPSLSIAPILDALNVMSVGVSEKNLSLGDKIIPIDRSGEYFVNLYGRYNAYSISGLITSKQMLYQGDVENLLVDPMEFRDKIVFIGTSATGLQDLKHTSMDRRMPGVLIHASAAGNILTNDYLRTVGRGSTIAFVVLLAFLTSSSVLLTRKIGIQITLVAILVIGYLALAMQQYSQNTIFEVVPPLLSIFLAWMSSFILLALTEGKEKKKVRKMLSQYVSPAVLKSVVDKHEDHITAEVGVTECVTILFSDIRGFTSLSESLDARKIVQMLNHYFTEMTEAIFTYDGTVDKFIGDAIMAFWGAPVKIDDHAEKSIQAALEMNARVASVNAWLKTQGAGPIRTGIGIHTGDVVIGNIGSEKKLDYTVIGDSVNLASRLEGLTKEYNVPILISQSTYDAIQHSIPCQVVDLVRVKGKSRPIRVYTPIVAYDHDNQSIDTNELIRKTEYAFARYLKRDWEGAIEAYSSLPATHLRTIFIERCRKFLECEPPDEWNGVFTMQTK